MQAGKGYTRSKVRKHDRVIAATFSHCLSSACNQLLQPPSLSSQSPAFGFCLHAQTQGWMVKAHEFINSGPPALLNNPPCCRRVLVFHSTHAMEVDYG